MPTKPISRRSLITWGRHPSHQNVWLKLHRYSTTQNKARLNEGWELAFFAKGNSPAGDPDFA